MWAYLVSVSQSPTGCTRSRSSSKCVSTQLIADGLHPHTEHRSRTSPSPTVCPALISTCVCATSSLIPQSVLSPNSYPGTYHGLFAVGMLATGYAVVNLLFVCTFLFLPVSFMSHRRTHRSSPRRRKVADRLYRGGNEIEPVFNNLIPRTGSVRHLHFCEAVTSSERIL